MSDLNLTKYISLHKSDVNTVYDSWSLLSPEDTNNLEILTSGYITFIDNKIWIPNGIKQLILSYYPINKDTILYKLLFDPPLNIGYNNYNNIGLNRKYKIKIFDISHYNELNKMFKNMQIHGIKFTSMMDYVIKLIKYDEKKFIQCIKDLKKKHVNLNNNQKLIIKRSFFNAIKYKFNQNKYNNNLWNNNTIKSWEWFWDFIISQIV